MSVFDFHYRAGNLFAEDVSLARIASVVGTPCYVYSSAGICRQYQKFAQAFAHRPDTLIAFAVKANSNIAVLQTLARLGAGADTVSEGEIRRALQAGIPPERIVFSGVGKSDAELAFAVQLGLEQINIESPDELERLAQIAAAMGLVANVAVRVNPDVLAGGHAKIATGDADSKFGVSLAEAGPLYARACALPNIKAQGLTCHIGSQITELAPFAEAFGKMRDLAKDLLAQGLPLSVMDLGGGIGVPDLLEAGQGAPDPLTMASYANMIENLFADLPVRLGFEPGRYLVANAGLLLTRVQRIHARADKNFMVLDAAMNDLIRPALYEAVHPLWPLQQTAQAAPLQTYDVVGPVCESGDTFAKDYAIAEQGEGAILAFMSAGAYGAAMSSNYNTRPLVAEVLVHGQNWAVIRPRQSYAELLGQDRPAPWLAG